MWLEAGADVEERAVVLVGRRDRVGHASIVLDVVPVLDVRIPLELSVRADTATTRGSTLAGATVLATTALDAAADCTPALGVVRKKRVGRAGQLADGREHGVGRRRHFARWWLLTIL